MTSQSRKTDDFFCQKQLWMKMQAESIFSAHENRIGCLGLQYSLPMDQAVGCVNSFELIFPHL